MAWRASNDLCGWKDWKMLSLGIRSSFGVFRKRERPAKGNHHRSECDCAQTDAAAAMQAILMNGRAKFNFNLKRTFRYSSCGVIAIYLREHIC